MKTRHEHRRVTARLLAVVVAAGSLTAIPFATPAGAATGTSCSGSKTVTNLKAKSATSTLTGCTNPAATGGKGKEVVNLKVITAVTAKITWNKTGTTLLKITQKAGPKPNKCPKGTTMVVSTGSVTGGSGAALKGIPKGSKLKQSVCYSSKGVVTLYPGSKVVIK